MNIKLLFPVTALALLGILTGCGSNHSGGGKTQASPSQWMSTDLSTKTVNLKLEAAYGNTAGGFNFDGYANGDMTVTIPKGWTVQVAFSNDSSMPHSAMVVPYEDRQASSLSESSAAFHGSFTPNPLSGISQGTNQKFSFVADKPGQYAIVCAVPGHDSAGMWGTLVVSDTATNATISTK